MLGRLHRFPVDRLKIDRSFVREITSAHAEAPIVAAIIAMARSLGMETVAEGVETLEQQTFLRNRSCDLARASCSATRSSPRRSAGCCARRRSVSTCPASADFRSAVRRRAGLAADQRSEVRDGGVVAVEVDSEGVGSPSAAAVGSLVGLGVLGAGLGCSGPRVGVVVGRGGRGWRVRRGWWGRRRGGCVRRARPGGRWCTTRRGSRGRWVRRLPSARGGGCVASLGGRRSDSRRRGLRSWLAAWGQRPGGGVPARWGGRPARARRGCRRRR